MKREIIFRGKRINTGEWVEGNLVVSDDGTHDIITGVSIVPKMESTYVWDEVIPESVGQFTGLTDKDGKKIFEGDIIKSTTTQIKFEVTFAQGAFKACGKTIFSPSLWKHSSEKIGNIHDNPELK